MEISKHDWKVFREKLPQWQERYMERLNQEYMEILSGNGNASDKFWALDERIKQDKRRPGVLASVSRSNMYPILLGLLHDDAISEEDLKDFSEDVRDALRRFRTGWPL